MPQPGDPKPSAELPSTSDRQNGFEVQDPGPGHVIIGVIASVGVWLCTFGSSSVVDSLDTVVSVDGLLFALYYYALTGIATAVYYRNLARTSVWNIIHIAVFPLAAALRWLRSCARQ